MNVGREDLLLTLMYYFFFTYLFSGVKENSLIYVFRISDDLSNMRVWEEAFSLNLLNL